MQLTDLASRINKGHFPKEEGGKGAMLPQFLSSGEKVPQGVRTANLFLISLP